MSLHPHHHHDHAAPDYNRAFAIGVVLNVVFVAGMGRQLPRR
jgi:hypothetical protein